MLREEVSCVYEQQESLPNNHSAVLRFRSSIIADTLNIPFKEVKVLKSVAPWRNPIADALSYSRKTNGSATLRSILSAKDKLETRYIAPPDLIERMAKKVSIPITYGVAFDEWDVTYRKDPIISTLPMPVLMKLLGWKPKSEFHYKSGHNIIIELQPEVDAYCSLYTPDPALPFARLSLTGNQLIAECNADKGRLAPDDINSILHQFGFTQGDVENVEVKAQPYAKILPIDEGERQRFIMHASDKFNIYALGRFATWRPGLLMDDCVKDVRIIHKLINDHGTTYSHKLKGNNDGSATDRLHRERVA